MVIFAADGEIIETPKVNALSKQTKLLTQGDDEVRTVSGSWRDLARGSTSPELPYLIKRHRNLSDDNYAGLVAERDYDFDNVELYYDLSRKEKEILVEVGGIAACQLKITEICITSQEELVGSGTKVEKISEENSDE